MIIVQITGGLGNQMFQYATGKALALHHDTNLKLDLQSFYTDTWHELEVPRSFELTAFKNLEYKEATLKEIQQFHTSSFIGKRIQKLLPRHKRKVYSEKEYPFDSSFFKAKKNIYIKGHRQSEKYFQPYKKEVCNIYQLKDELVSDVKELGKKLSYENSVAIHVRRGDYLRLPIILDWHGVLDESYYCTALNILNNQFPDLKIYYFSDDPQWVNQTLMPLFPGTIVSENISKTHYHDFHLIQSCKHQIVANSSFSWWAAWLNPNPEKIVIAPKKWFNNAPYDTRDLIPEEWLRI
jgi:hypothetical protein